VKLYGHTEGMVCALWGTQGGGGGRPPIHWLVTYVTHSTDKSLHLHLVKTRN